ncbi:hypothetical protein Poli38472_007771 [Pythium oligandrum]|uniref:Uncharacterized protein n=1 Tax=Pythium oligandrum TaxID=41045 RepID=A0A8K1FP78_PYTOL|nr:hypothetical protein Poli38472_007771 [Pythium oligandrum]|eukprot:TMW68099.1 hypothetical protein Poli38472_007771 [Pythium oligandrum]
MSTERKGAEMDRPRESEEKTETDVELLPNAIQVGNVQVVMTTYARGNGENEGGQSSGDSASTKRKASSRSPPSNQTELGDAVTVSAEELKKDNDDDDSTENKLRLPTIKLD